MAVKGKKGKMTARERKKLRIRKNLCGTDERPRISIFRSSKHMYAQAISDTSASTLVSASTRDSEVLAEVDNVLAKLNNAAGGEGEKSERKALSVSKSSKSMAAAAAVGYVFAKRCLEKNIKNVVFDRNGFVYHGRVKALADGARKGGLDF